MLTPTENREASEKLANIQKDWNKLEENVQNLLQELKEALEGGDNK